MWRSGEKDFQYEQASPDHDAAVSQVEYGPLILFDVEEQEIHHMAAGHSIPQITHGSAQNQR